MKSFLSFALFAVFLHWSISCCGVLAQRRAQGESEEKVVVLCFSEKATVQTLDKGVIPMKQLEVGDAVLTGKHHDRYEPVYGFGHRDPSKPAEFLKISTSKNTAPLEITGNHMVFVEGKDHPVRADSIKEGDSLKADDESFVSVEKIRKVTRKGLYAPLTPSGSIVVNGIVASNYISLQENAVEYAEFSNGVEISFFTQQLGCHMWMSPMRLLCIGVSSRFCESHDEDGLMPWIRFGQQFLEWGLKLNVFIQAILLGAAFLMFSGFNLVELVFGAEWGVMICVPLLISLLLISRSRLSVVVRKEKKKLV